MLIRIADLSGTGPVKQISTVAEGDEIVAMTENGSQYSSSSVEITARPLSALVEADGINGIRGKQIELESLLEVAKRNQWSVHDFDWQSPVVDGIARSRKQRKLLARMLLMTAGFERLGVDAFMIHAKHTDNKTAKTIFQLIALDEQRHADAEVELAKRLGWRWHDLPLPVRAMFKQFSRDIRRAGRTPASKLLHEFGTSGIPIAELALDTLLLPALKKMSNDPLLIEAFKLIDRDEARHIAMDYWLLEEKGKARKNRTNGHRNVKSKKSGYPFRATSIALAAIGLISFAWSVRESPMDGDDFLNYWKRLLSVESKAPHSMEVKSFRVSVDFLKSCVDFFERNPVLFKAALFAVTGRTK